MAQTPSNMIDLGTPAPDFALPGTDGRRVALADFAASPALLVMFLCNHCPFVKHVQSELTRRCREWQARGVAVVAISSNDATAYPDDAPDKMRLEHEAAGYTFPYLYDETQNVARSYGAACTPDFFLYDRARKLVYRGQLDDSRPGNGRPVTGADLGRAIDALLAGTPMPAEQRPSVGCNIKWKTGSHA